jgi:DNA-binding NtrC family response regulator
VLERAGYSIVAAATAREALTCLAREAFSTVLCDIRMPEMDGLTFLDELLKAELNPTVIMMSAYGSLDTAVACLKKGAYDYISKPFKPDEVLLTLKKAEEHLRLLRENALLKQELDRQGGGRELIYRSSVMKDLLREVQQVAAVRSSVLITGETGTGKELIARALHFNGPRKQGPFLAINCSAITATLLESELFGHARGAFTGADKSHDGLFLSASGGTVFLDEIGELPLEFQPKLLRVLQESEVRRVGESKSRPIDVRVVTATARDLLADVESGTFRRDLYYRLAVVELHLPPLRERITDIPQLAEHFISRIARRERRTVPVLIPEVVKKLQQYPWPGNVRELENFIEKTMIFQKGETIGQDSLPGESLRKSPRDENFSLKEAVARMEREYIRKALLATEGNRTRAAELLEISLRALHYKIKELELD